MKISETMLVSAPNRAGECFIVFLQKMGIPFVALVNSRVEFDRATSLGIANVYLIDTKKEDVDMPEHVRIGKVVLFEKSFNLCCRYIQICRSWTNGPIYTVSESGCPRMKYKSLGADYVLHLKGGDKANASETDIVWSMICK